MMMLPAVAAPSALATTRRRRADNAQSAVAARPSIRARAVDADADNAHDEARSDQASPSRRAALLSLAAPAATAAALLLLSPAPPSALAAGESVVAGSYEPMAGIRDKDYGKSRMRYPDYETTPSGLQYKELRSGDVNAQLPRPGDLCVIDYDGYTIGYYGRPFEARNKPKGSSFVDDDKDYYRFTLGGGAVIPAIEEAVAGMRPGAIRRLIVPVELGYPAGKNGLPDSKLKGPRPTTFSGQRALDFVLQNQGLIDKTLLFDVQLMRIDRK